MLLTFFHRLKNLFRSQSDSPTIPLVYRGRPYYRSSTLEEIRKEQPYYRKQYILKQFGNLPK